MSLINRLKIASKLNLSIMLLIVVGLLGLMFYTRGNVDTEIRRQAKEQMEDLVMSHSVDIALELNGAMRTASVMAGSIGGLIRSGEMDRSSYRAIVQEIAEQSTYVGMGFLLEPDSVDGHDADFADTRFSDKTGRLMGYAERQADGKVVVGPIAGYEDNVVSQPDGNWYTIPRNTKKATLTEPYLYNGIRMTTAAAPIIVDGKFYGVATVDLSLKQITDLVTGIKVLDTGYLFLLSDDGNIIAHHKTEFIGKNLFTEVNRNFEKMRSGIESGKAYQDILLSATTGTEALFVSVPVTVGDAPEKWKIILGVPVEETLSTLDTITRGLMIASIVLIVVMFAMVLLIARSSRRPRRGARPTNGA